MHMVTRHFIEATFHNQRQRIKVSPVDDLRILERIFNWLKEVFRFHLLDGMTLNCSYHENPFNLFKLKSFFIVALDDLLDVVDGKFLSIWFLKDVFDEAKAICSDCYAFFLSSMSQNKTQILRKLHLHALRKTRHFGTLHFNCSFNH